jgi:hypothetical protein
MLRSLLSMVSGRTGVAVQDGGPGAEVGGGADVIAALAEQSRVEGGEFGLVGGAGAVAGGGVDAVEPEAAVALLRLVREDRLGQLAVPTCQLRVTQQPAAAPQVLVERVDRRIGRGRGVVELSAGLGVDPGAEQAE